MKVEFIGGDDVQRSLNHSDNRCVNLIPALNDKGDIAAFYGAPGLTLEVTNPDGAVGSGIYTASNGRCFEVAGTTLYELIDTAGVISTTSRGTVTVGNPIYRMIDNGIEMILVNGTDGWLFTFATNTLKKIKVASADFTVTIANPAVFTKTAHGLVAGDAIRLTSTTGSILSDTILTASAPSTVSSSYVPLDVIVAPSGDFVYSANSPSAISLYSRDTVTGELSPLSPPTAAVGFANNLALSSDGISLYVGCLNTVYVFDVNTSTGALSASSPANVTPEVGTGTLNVAISPDDAFVYFTGAVTNKIYQYSRNLGTGVLSALTPASVSCAGTPGEIVVSDDGLFAYVSCSGTDDIKVFSRNAVTGLLTAATPASISCGGLAPDGIKLAPETNNPYLYVVNNGSNEIEVFSRNSSTGALTNASLSISTGTSPKKIIIVAESAYVTNYSSNTVSMYVRDSSTGALTSASTASISTGTAPVGIDISPDGNSVYVANSGGTSISQFARNGTETSVGLPTGLQELTTYYVISAGLTADNFEVSETEGGTAVATSGQQAGVHTYTTLGYGFPEGAKTVSYMNGRFVALEPNTQNFYVSEVLDGKWWDALNVQTVDSNPDYVIGETVSHNELIVFCQDSGEVFYDSGETPSPFVRNTSGIFEVGCVAPYSICNLDNQVFWLGGTKNGSGIVYKLQGFTPMRISTHSIEYAIQSMTDITDARAFSYQRDGHHYYVLSFPTGNKTFSYDVNTGMWVELADWNGSTYSRFPAQECAYFAGKHLALGISGGYVFSIDPTVYKYGSNDIKWLRSFKVPTANMNKERHTRLQLDCEVGNGTVISGGSVASITMTNNGTSQKVLSWSPTTSAITNFTVAGIAWNGSVYCAVGSNGAAASTTCYTSPDGINWTARTIQSAVWLGITWDGVNFAAISDSSQAAYSSDGITWNSATMPATNSFGGIASNATRMVAVYAGVISNYSTDHGVTWNVGGSMPGTGDYWKSIAWNGTVFCAIATNVNGTVCATSTNGAAWTARTLPALTTWKSIAWNGTVFCAIATNSTRAATSADGITWTSRTLPSNYAWSSITAVGDTFCIVNTTNNNTYVSTDGATWTLYTISGSTGQFNSLSNNGTNVVTMGTTSTVITAISSVAYVGGTYSLTFTGGGGSAAAGTYTISATTGQITGTAITNAGSGYTSAPTVGFPSGGISGAAGTAVMTYVYTSPTVTLKWSDDGARTFNTGLTQTTGGLGEYSKRVVWHRLGMTKGQPRVYELSSSDPVKTTLLNVHLD